MNKEFEVLRLEKILQARLSFSLAFDIAHGEGTSQVVRLDERIDDRKGFRRAAKNSRCRLRIQHSLIFQFTTSKRPQVIPAATVLMSDSI